MLKSNKVKIIIGAFIALCVLAASSIWVMNYKNPNEVEEFSYTNLAAGTDNQTASTQIDYIVENSLTDGEDSYYNVYIITNGVSDVSDAVKNFIGQSGENSFQQVIINDNRTISSVMADNKIRCTVKSVSDLNGLTYEEIGSELGNADLIYIYAASSVAYEGDKDFSENLYKFLHDDYAFSSNGKPLIMSYGLANTGGKDDDSTEEEVSGVDSKMYKLTSSTFKYSYRYSHTTNVPDWTKDTTGDAMYDILESYIISPRSLYSQYQASTAKKPNGYDSWTQYWQRTGTSDSTLNVLYIYGDTLENEKSQIDKLAEWMVNDGQNYAFTGSSENYPTTYNVEAKCAEDLTPEFFYTDDGVKKYDYIFIAPDSYAADIKDEALAELVTLSNDNNTYILFGTLTGRTVIKKDPTPSQPEDLVFNTETNFGKLLDLSITTTGYAKSGVNNVLVVGVDYMDTLAKNPGMNHTKVATIVSLINKSTYRNHAGSGAGGTSGSVSTTAFRVLELQPCYPIDLELALKTTTVNGNLTSYNGYDRTGDYYTIPSNVLNTSEIDNYTEADGTINSEYYQWDLSKAKLAYALNIQADQIDLVQMSTEEFISSKTDAASSYDLIYIGGNMSALRPSRSLGAVYSSYTVTGGKTSLLSLGWGQTETIYSLIATYSMYSHTGEVLKVDNDKLGSAYNYTTLGGNDITYDRLQSLKSYVDAGMPIVFSNEVWTAYEKAKNESYKNNYIDPDSNMYALCEYAESSNKTSVLSNWAVKVQGAADTYYEDYWSMPVCTNADETDGTVKRVSNDSGICGIASTVTVFTDALSDELYDLVMKNSNTRPKYTITTNAVAYVESDESTRLTNRNLTWRIELTNPIENHSYQAILLEDANDNAEFDINSDEKIVSTDVAKYGNSGSLVLDLAYNYPEKEFGAFSWKILVLDVTDMSNSIADCPQTGYSAISMIARGDLDKKEATILEIIPANTESITSNMALGPTFYLDSFYQQSGGSHFLYSTYTDYKYNGKPTTASDGTDLSGMSYIEAMQTAISKAPKDYAPYGYNTYFNSTGVYYKHNTTKGEYTSGSYYLGMHETILSINRYDSTADAAQSDQPTSTAGREDWTYNYVDSITDDYNLTLDIMYMDDIQYYADKTRELTDEERAEYANLAATYEAKYNAYVTSGNSKYVALQAAAKAVEDKLNALRNVSGVDTTDLDGIIESGRYYRFFYNNYNKISSNPDVKAFYYGEYSEYVELADNMIDCYRRYRHYNMLAYGPEEYLNENYSVIVIGFYDEAASNAKVVDFRTGKEADDLESFLNADGQVLLTHDNMTRYGTSDFGGKEHLFNLTTTLRSYAGMERFGELTSDNATETSGVPRYVTADNDKYFFTTLSSDGNLGTSSGLSGAAWNTAVTNWNTSLQSLWLDSTKLLTQFGYPGYADAFLIVETKSHEVTPYAFAEFNIFSQTNYNGNVGDYVKVTGTTKVTQINRGVVTTYPFYIASDLRISSTHNQAYALDLEDDEVTVWYALAADNQGDNSASTIKGNSSLYAASPRDGADSYYIYSVGSVTYCGAGGAGITGPERDNNDERRLFLNVLVNMAKKGTKKPVSEEDIILYDPDGVTKAPGKVVKFSDENGYYIDVTSNVIYPEFGFAVEKKASAKIDKVEVFYDLDYSATADDDVNGAYKNDDKHYLVTLPEDVIKSLEAGDTYVLTKENCPSLITQPSYFSAYDGTYTYLVIRVELSDGTILTKRIKVVITRNLLELT